MSLFERISNNFNIVEVDNDYYDDGIYLQIISNVDNYSHEKIIRNNLIKENEFYNWIPFIKELIKYKDDVSKLDECYNDFVMEYLPYDDFYDTPLEIKDITLFFRSRENKKEYIIEI